MVQHTFKRNDYAEYCGQLRPLMKGQRGIVIDVDPDGRKVTVKFDNYEVVQVVSVVSLRPIFKQRELVIDLKADLTSGLPRMQKDSALWYERSREARAVGNTVHFIEAAEQASVYSFQARWIAGIETKPRKIMATRADVGYSQWSVTLLNETWSWPWDEWGVQWKMLYKKGYCICFEQDGVIYTPTPEWTSLDWIKIK